MTDQEEQQFVTHPDMLKLGITARKIDYWTRQGYLRTEARTNSRSGYPRRWPAAERDIAALMEKMTTAGISPEVAAKAARQAIEQGTDHAILGNGLTVFWKAVA